jgi:hypothetical protein
MPAKRKKSTRNPDFRTAEEAGGDLTQERFLADHHDAVEAKLQQARASIARGEAQPLEALPDLLREARRRAKGAA